MEGIQTLKGSWPWPWIRTYGIPSCVTHRPLPIYQISLKSKKLFVDGRTDARLKALSAQIAISCHRSYEVYHIGSGNNKKTYHAIKQCNNTNNPRPSWTLFGLGSVETIPLPQLGFLRGVFLANHLASNDNLTSTTKRQNTYQRKLAIHKRGPTEQRYN